MTMTHQELDRRVGVAFCKTCKSYDAYEDDHQPKSETPSPDKCSAYLCNDGACPNHEIFHILLFVGLDDRSSFTETGQKPS